MFNYTELKSEKDIELYLSLNLKKRPQYKKYEALFDYLCRSVIAFTNGTNSTDDVLQRAIEQGGGELVNVINASKQILQELQDGATINFTTYWSYLRSYPLAKGIIDQILLTQERSFLNKKELRNIVNDGNLVYDKLEEIINTAREEVTKTAFNTIGGHFQKSELQNKKLRESENKSRTTELGLLKKYLIRYIIGIFLCILIGLICKTSVETIRNIILLFSIPLGVLILVQYLSVHFHTKNYFYFLGLEKDAGHRKAIGGTFSLIAEGMKGDLDATNRTEVVKELSKRLFEPVTSNNTETDFTSPVIELIKSFKKN